MKLFLALISALNMKNVLTRRCSASQDSRAEQSRAVDDCCRPIRAEAGCHCRLRLDRLHSDGVGCRRRAAVL